MEQSELDRRVEEEARDACARWSNITVSAPWAQISPCSRSGWHAAVRPIVERLAAAEDARDGLADNMRLAQERIQELEADRGDLSADDVDRLRRALYAGPEESTLAAAERVSKALEAEREARRAADARAARIPELEARIIEIDRERSAALGELTKTWRRVTDAEDERDRQAAYGARLADEIEGVKGERDEALSMVRRYRVQLAEVVGREAALRAALADARAGLRALARDLLGVEVAARAVVEVGSD